MKVIFLGIFCLAVCITADKYPDKLFADVSDILGNKEHRTALFKCLIDKGKCNKEGESAKKYIPDMLKTKCSKCTAAHKKELKMLVLFFLEKDKKKWDALLDKYDPKRKYIESMLTDPKFLENV